jgi:hypothetical protein
MGEPPRGMSPTDFMTMLRNDVTKTVVEALRISLAEDWQRLTAEAVRVASTSARGNAQVYVVQRRSEDGDFRQIPTTIPQLLAEMNDHMIELKEIMDRRPRRGR